jgi:hypothetical protein
MRVVRSVRAWVGRRSHEELALGLPLLLVVVYAGRLAQTFQDRLTVVGGDTDAIGPLFIAATMDDLPDADVHMAGVGHYLPLWYARATEWLPFHREIWEVIPPILWLASVGIIVWAAWRTFGKHAAILTGVLGFCVSPALLYVLFTSSYHTWTLYSSAVAVGLVVFLTTQSRVSARVWVVGVATAIVLGAAFATDRLVLLGAIAPLLLAGAGVALRHPTRQGRMVGLAAGAVAMVAIAIGAGLTEVMEAAGFVTYPRDEAWVDAPLFFDKVGTFLEESLTIFNANFFGRTLSIESALSFATAAGVVVALVAPFIILRRRLREPKPAGTALDLGRSAYIFFWAATTAIVALAAITSAQEIEGASRYVLPLLFAVAATMPLLARSSTARYLVIAGISAYALLGVLNAEDRGKWVPGFEESEDLQRSAARIAIQANELSAIADQEQAHVGYAGYWEAASSTWSTKLRVKVFPIDHYCDAADGVPCPKDESFVHGGWYEPDPGIRTFLIGPRPEDLEQRQASSYPPPPGLGRPISTHRLSNGAHLYVYPYDIASRFPPFRVQRG